MPEGRNMMARLDDTCLYIVWCRLEDDADEADEADWNRWYDDEHVSAMLTVPGVNRVTRYRDMTEPRGYVAIYELDSPAVLDHPRYQEVRGWGPWAAAVADWGRIIIQHRTPSAEGAGEVG
jgi:hypothetical protein